MKPGGGDASAQAMRAISNLDESGRRVQEPNHAGNVIAEWQRDPFQSPIDAVAPVALAEDAPELPEVPEVALWQLQAVSGASNVAPSDWPAPRDPLPRTGVDQLTVLTTLYGETATKRITRGRDGAWVIEPYGSARHYRVDLVGVDDLVSLGRALARLERAPHSFVIRGQPLPGTNLSRCRRLKYERPDGARATFGPTARRWLGIDIDGVPTPTWPERVDQPPIDPLIDREICAEYVAAALPPAFRRRSFFYQLTSSAGIKSGVRLRTWHWLDRLVADAEAKFWLDSYPVDAALFDPIQAHYTARPLFDPPTLDPVPVRSGFFWNGPNTVAVPDVTPPARPARRPYVATAEVSGDAVAYRAQLCASVAGATEGRRHDVLKNAASIAFSIAFTGRDDPDAVERALIDAVATCCPRPDDRRRKANLIAWCRARAETNPSVPREFR